jgi:hypothetical protein
MPGKHRISSEQAMLFIGSIRDRLAIFALSEMNMPNPCGFRGARNCRQGNL